MGAFDITRCSIAITVVALAMPSSSASAQSSDSSALIRRLAGCYVLTLSPSPRWTASPSQTPPEHFRLESTMRADSLPRVRPSSLHLGVMPRTLESNSLMEASWQLSMGDSVIVAWSTGFSGVVLRLSVQGDSLVGTAHTFIDLPPPPGVVEPTASIVARRVSCAPL